MFSLLRNTDQMPPMPIEMTRDALTKWGELLVERSRKFADNNRFAAVFCRPAIATLVGLTGAAGVATTFQKEYAIVVVALSAAAAALAALFAWSEPEWTFVSDRWLQGQLWEELNRFKAKSGSYAADDLPTYVLFADNMTKLVIEQLREWAARRGGRNLPGVGLSNGAGDK
jgi:hypothetical protein